MNEIKMTENKTLLVVDTKIREKRVDDTRTRNKWSVREHDERSDRSEKTKNEVIEVICKTHL